jgi:hypothetical protein
MRTRDDIKLRNYKEVYDQLVKNSKPKKLNDYQQFVQTESKKEKYKKLKGSERLKTIANEWKKNKKKCKK